MLKLDRSQDELFDSKMKKKIEDEFRKIIEKEDSGATSDSLGISVSFRGDKIDIEVVSKDNDGKDKKFTPEEHSQGSSREKKYVDRIVFKLLDRLPALTKECEDEIR